jgi:hypothetical protein
MPDNLGREPSMENILPAGFAGRIVPMPPPGPLPTREHRGDHSAPVGSPQKPTEQISWEYPRDRGGRPPQ